MASGDQLYVIGNLGQTGAADPAAALKYDAATDTWQQKNSMPTPRRAQALAFGAGSIFAVSGTADGGQTSYTSEKYLVDSDSWLSVNDIPTRRQRACGAAAGGKLYGGLGCRISGG